MVAFAVGHLPGYQSRDVMLTSTTEGYHPTYGSIRSGALAGYHPRDVMLTFPTHCFI